jgi:PilZ domain
MDSERRRAPRYPIIADAEVTEIASETKLSAKTSDLSVGGCFLDTARGKVVFLFPNTGMGVMFTSVPASQQTVLEKWLEELSGGE